MFNPFLVQVEKYWDWRRAATDILYMPDDINDNYWQHCWTLRGKYALAIPTEDAIKRIAEYSPIVEIGAGLGYWAYLLDQIGADIRAYDICPGPNNDYNPERRESWFDVQRCSVDFVPPADRSLFLCWPPHDEPMAFNALKRYKGDTCIYIGEDYGAACADDAFFDELAAHWELVCQMDIPQFFGIHDDLRIYKRKKGD